ncbi:MAG TPA: PAS domain S-box protein, partial [Rhizobiales bacterium]|nr:PAS domain S-box protein [Hyphomicrobiales bacterium]
KESDVSSVSAFESSAARLKSLIRDLTQSALINYAKTPMSDLATSLHRYENAFNRTVVLKKNAGLDNNRGLQGAYRKAIRKVKQILAKLEVTGLKNRILRLRQNEMEYRITGEERFLSGFTNKYRALMASNAIPPDLSAASWHEVRSALQSYQENFLLWARTEWQMRKSIQEVNAQKESFLNSLIQVKDISSKMLQQTNALQRETREYTRQVILITLVLAAIVLIFLSTMVAASLSRPIKYLSWVMKGLARGETYHDIPYYTLDNELGEMARAVKVFKTGILARIKAEAELRETAERYNLAIKGTNSGIWDWDVAGRKSHYSESFMTVLGFEGENRVTHDNLLLDRIHPDDKELYLESIRNNLLKGEHRIDMEIRVRHENGADIWLQVIGWAVSQNNGRVTRAVGKITDISRLKNTELELRAHKVNLENKVSARTRELQESQNRLTEAINAIPEGFILSDTEDRVILVNDLMKQYYPDTAPIMRPGTHLRDMIKASFPHESEDKIDRRMRDYSNARSGEIRRLESGTWLHIVRKKIPGLGVIALYNDVTTFRQQEDELTEQAAKLELALSSERELSELQRSFVSLASHEFRTPLAIIDGIAHRLSRRAMKQRLDPDNVLTRVNQIRSSVKRMVNLMESTLSAARMDAGKVTVKPCDCDLRTVIEEVCERQRGISPSHNIITDLENLPRTIRADSAALEQVFTNLLSNAVKYAPDDPDIEIRAWQRGDDVMISIRDYGLGIDEDDLPGMFGRFFRAKSSTGIAGTGIGLNLVKMFVEEHGGRVMVESQIGEGSIFTVRLPIAGPQTRHESEDIQGAAEQAA